MYYFKPNGIWEFFSEVYSFIPPLFVSTPLCKHSTHTQHQQCASHWNKHKLNILFPSQGFKTLVVANNLFSLFRQDFKRSLSHQWLNRTFRYLWRAIYQNTSPKKKLKSSALEHQPQCMCLVLPQQHVELLDYSPFSAVQQRFTHFIVALVPELICMNENTSLRRASCMWPQTLATQQAEETLSWHNTKRCVSRGCYRHPQFLPLLVS